MTWAVIGAACLMAIGIGLRAAWPFLQRLFIPASVVAGFVGLAMVHAFGWKASARPVWVNELVDQWQSWPGWLIAVIFAGMLLERAPASPRDSLRRAGREGWMVWIIVLGETAVGLLLTWLVIGPWFDVPDAFGMLIETGFAGGHGTAAAMGEVFASEQINWKSGRDLGILVATFGLVYGLVSGVVWINVGVRRGWVSRARAPVESVETSRTNVGDHEPTMRAPVDPLWWQVIWLAMAMGVGLTLQAVVGWIGVGLDNVLGFLGEASEVVQAGDAAQRELGSRTTIAAVLGSFPLFIYTLFGGLFLRQALTLLGFARLIDGKVMSRLTAIAMDVLVVAAIASLNVQAVSTRLGAVSILLVGGAVWTAVCLLLISRWILPRDHWFELGLINYGMSTGTTATGFVLLRMVDAEFETGAAEDYALAAPLSSPFVGGGMITIGLPLLVLGSVPLGIVAIAVTAIVVVMVVAGRRLFRPPPEA